MKSKLNEKKAKEIVVKSGKAIAAAEIEQGRLKDELFMKGDQWTAQELAARQGASIAQDPIAALFTGIKFRTPTDRGILESKVRTYCYKQIGDNWKDAQNKFDTERSQLRLQIAILEEAIRTAKRNHASEIIEVTRGRVGHEAMGLLVADERRR
jgi:hypothetical protein